MPRTNECAWLLPRYWRKTERSPRMRRTDYRITATTPDGMLAEFIEWSVTWPRSLKDYYLDRIEQDPAHVDELGIEGLTADRLRSELRKAWAR